MIENVSNELKKYFEGKPVISSLLGLDMIVFYAAVALTLIGAFISLGMVSTLVFFAFILGALLCLANRNFNALMIGFAGASLVEVIGLIRGMTWGFLSWGSLFYLVIYGYFAYAAYKKSLAK